MPFSGGTAGAHDDSMHQGDAKRDVVDGVAALNATGDVLGKGSSICLTRSASHYIYISDRLSTESIVRFLRITGNDFIGWLKVGATWQEIQHAALKDIANGIAALGAGGELLAPGSEIELTRDGSENIEVIERTSGEIVYRWTRVGVDDYECRIHCGGVACLILNDSMIDVANGIAGLDAAGKITGSLYDGILKKYIISDNLLNDHVETAWTSSTSYEKLLTTTINALYPSPSILRIKFDMKTGVSAETVYGRIYKNGAPVGIERTTNSTSMVTFSEDISFADGDTIEFWGHRTVAGASLNMENFRVYGDDHQQTIAESIIQSDVGVADAWSATNTKP